MWASVLSSCKRVCERLWASKRLCLEWPACCVVFTWVWRYQSISACRRVETQTLRHIGLAVDVGQPGLLKHIESIDRTKSSDQHNHDVFHLLCAFMVMLWSHVSCDAVAGLFESMCASHTDVFICRLMVLFICTVCVCQNNTLTACFTPYCICIRLICCSSSHPMGLLAPPRSLILPPHWLRITVRYPCWW